MIVFFLSYVLWFLVSASQALEPAVSVPFILELFKLALPFFVGVTLMEGQDDWRRMLWVIVLAQGYVGLEQNINYLVKGYNSAALGFGGMDNNCFAASLVTVLGPALALMISSTRWYSRVLACAAAAFILHTTFLTFSRGAMIGLIALAVTAFVIMPKRPRYIAALLLTGLIAARFVGPELLNRYKSAFAAPDERDASSESRLELWMSCLEVIESYRFWVSDPPTGRLLRAVRVARRQVRSQYLDGDRSRARRPWRAFSDAVLPVGGGPFVANGEGSADRGEPVPGDSRLWRHPLDRRLQRHGPVRLGSSP